MAATGGKVHVDEDTGKDDPSADGSETSPYKSLLFAHIQHPPSPTDGPQYFTRKSETGPVNEDGDPEARKEWKPATKSGEKFEPKSQLLIK